MKTSIKLFIALALCLALCFALISCNDEHVHSPSNPVIENEVAGSCTVDHTYDEVVYCSTCDEEISRTPHNEGKGQHNFVNGACTACNEPEPEPEPEPSEGLEFSLNSDNVSYSVSGIGTCTDTDIVIPSSYNDLPVTSIGVGAFSWCTSLTSITIPDSVTSIGEYAFFACSSLTSITIPDSVTSIGASTFYGCSSLTGITIPDSVTSIGDSAFGYCSSLTSITIPDSVTSIGSDEFSNCSSPTIYCEATSQPSGWDSNWNFSNCPVVWDYNNNDVADDGYIYTVVDGVRYGIEDGVATVMEQPTSITEANIKSSIVYKSNTYSVTSIGEYAFEDCLSLTSITIPDSVTSIGDSAFSGCTSLTSITIPNSVTSIGEYAFGDCESLTEITVDSNNTVYKDIDGNLYTKDGKTLIHYAKGKVSTSFTLSDSVTSIGKYAFHYCSSLTSITIPDSVTSIGDWAFGGCSSLTIYCEVTSEPSGWDSGWKGYSNCPVVWDCNNNDVADDGYIYTVVDGMRYGIKEGVATVMEQPTSITEANIKSSIVYKSNTYSVISIGDSAFGYCSSLTSITIPDSVTTISWRAFYYCSSLTSITIPNSVTSIGEYAFGDCTSLTSITIPDSVTSISNMAFYGCSSLAEITVDSNNAVYKDIDGNLYTKDGKTLIKYAVGKVATSFTLPESVTIIGEGAFSFCTSLTSITIPNSVTSIGGGAFGYCSSLASITIPDGVTSIGNNAFSNCTSLTSITIPDSVTSIGSSAFHGCSSLTIYCEATSQPSGWDSNWNSSNCPVVWGYTGEE